MDRCDRCSDRARVWWVSDTDSEGWAFCAHHGHTYEPALRALGYELWMDDRDALAEQVTVAPAG